MIIVRTDIDLLAHFRVVGSRERLAHELSKSTSKRSREIAAARLSLYIELLGVLEHHQQQAAQSDEDWLARLQELTHGEDEIPSEEQPE